MIEDYKRVLTQNTSGLVMDLNERIIANALIDECVVSRGECGALHC